MKSNLFLCLLSIIFVADLSAQYKVGKHIAILASFENTYENFNVVGIQNSQTNTTIGLVYSGSN